MQTRCESGILFSMRSHFSIIKKAVLHFQNHNAARMGAAVAYYTIFSIAPLLVLLILLASTIFPHAAVVNAVSMHLTHLFGASLTAYLLSLTDAFSTHTFSVVGAVISAVVLFLAAIGTISEVNADLEELWLIPRRTKTPKKGIFRAIKVYFKERAIMFFLIILGAALLIISIATSIILSSAPGFHWLQAAITFVLGGVLFVAVYRLLPDVQLPYRELIRGAFLTSILFLIGRVGIGMYLSYSDVGSYGAAGSLIAILIWIFYSAQVFFLAASWMFVYSKECGFLSK